MNEMRKLRPRALLGTVLVISLALLIPATVLAFGDVTEGSRYSEAITDLSDRGIIQGFGDDTFRPAEPVWRQQFAKMIVITLDLPVSESLTDSFTDVARTPGELYPYHYVAAAANQGITNGVTATLFKPYDNITRAQVITMVVRAVDALHPGTLSDPGAGFISSWGAFSVQHGANAAKAEANGLLQGLAPPGTALSSIDPLGDMSRGEVAQVLHNLLGLLDDPSSPPASTATTTTTTPSTTTSTTAPPSPTTSTIPPIPPSTTTTQLPPEPPPLPPEPPPLPPEPPPLPPQPPPLPPEPPA